MSANHHHHTSKPHLVASLELCNYGVYYAGDKFVCKLVLCARDGALPSAATAASETTTTTTTTTAGSSNGTTPSSGSSPMMTRKGPASVDGVASGQDATVRVGCVVVQLQGYCVLDKTVRSQRLPVLTHGLLAREGERGSGATAGPGRGKQKGGRCVQQPEPQERSVDPVLRNARDHRRHKPRPPGRHPQDLYALFCSFFFFFLLF